MLRLVLSPRWIVWHVLTLGAMVTCGLLAAWQFGRAGSALGSAINIGYGLQWPLFAVFFGVMWWRFLRMEVQQLREMADDSAAGTPPGAASPALHDPVSPAPTEPPADPNNRLTESPFRRSPHRADAVTAEDNPALAEYNRMLAQLADQGRDRPAT